MVDEDGNADGVVEDRRLLLLVPVNRRMRWQHILLQKVDGLSMWHRGCLGHVLVEEVVDIEAAEEVCS